jgi:hypothetical protein
MFDHEIVLKICTDILVLCQQLNTATSPPADDIHHYVISQKLLDSIFNKLPLFIRHWEKRKGCSVSGRSPALIADSSLVATMARKQRIKFARN